MPDYARACRPLDYAPNYAIMPSIMARALVHVDAIVRRSFARVRGWVAVWHLGTAGQTPGLCWSASAGRTAAAVRSLPAVHPRPTHPLARTHNSTTPPYLHVKGVSLPRWPCAAPWRCGAGWALPGSRACAAARAPGPLRALGPAGADCCPALLHAV